MCPLQSLICWAKRRFFLSGHRGVGVFDQKQARNAVGRLLGWSNPKVDFAFNGPSTIFSKTLIGLSPRAFYNFGMAKGA